MQLQLVLNHEPVSCDVDPCVRLIDLLRDTLGAKGVKEGCGEGECGACTVLIDGNPANSCLVLAAQVEGAQITTVEGLSANGELHPVQQAFAETGAVQCGFCTPGFILSTVALLRRNADPSDDEIKLALAGHLCRCTGYQKIMDAVRRASKLIGSDGPNAQETKP